VWIIATVLGVFLLFVLLFAIPVDLVFCVEKDVDFKSRVRVRWMFGLIGRDITSRKKRPEKEKKKRKGNIKPLLAMLRTRGFLQKLTKFVKHVFQLLNVRELKLNLRVGLSDPAETGFLFAVIGPAMVYVKSLSSLDVHVEPDFEQENLRGYFQGDLRASPIQFVKPFALFLFSATTIRAIKAMVAARRE